MTLKEKFNELVPKEFGGMQEPLLSECEQIADDYAIEFAEWLPNNSYKESKCWRMFDKKDNEYTTQELLEIFKKEKGL